MAAFLVNFFQLAADGRALGHHDQLFLGKILKLHRAAVSQRMRGGHGQKQVLHHHGHAFQCSIQLGAEGKVDHAVLQLLHQVGAKILHKVKQNGAVRVFLIKALDHLRNERGGNAVQIAQGHALLGGIHHGVKGIHAGGDGVERLLYILHKHLPGGGKLKFAVFLFKQLGAKLFFQFGNGIAQAGLADVQVLGGLGVVQGFAKLTEILQLKKCHKNENLP